VRLSISVLTKEWLGCELSSKINLSINTEILGFTVIIGRYIEFGTVPYKEGCVLQSISEHLSRYPNGGRS